MEDLKRCSWVNPNNDIYIKYHDLEWGKIIHDDKYLYELFILECFQAGLSWECILNKRDYFRNSYDNFDIDKVINYDENKISELLKDSNIIRNKLKIRASIKNSIVFKNIQKEYGSFDKYIWSFTNNTVVYEPFTTNNRSVLSDTISKDLKNRGMSFVGSITIYSYLQAIGIINGHSKECYLYRK